MTHNLQRSELYCRFQEGSALQHASAAIYAYVSFQNVREVSASCRIRFFVVCGGGTKNFPQRRKNTRTAILSIWKLQEQMFPWTFAHPQNMPCEHAYVRALVCVRTCWQRRKRRKDSPHWVAERRYYFQFISGRYLFQLVLMSFTGIT